eukprot:9029385-Pyramimonas_sp.AAC.1
MASTCPQEYNFVVWPSKGWQGCQHTSTMQSPSFALTLAATLILHSECPSESASYLTGWLLYKRIQRRLCFWYPCGFSVIYVGMSEWSRAAASSSDDVLVSVPNQSQTRRVAPMSQHGLWPI